MKIRRCFWIMDLKLLNNLCNCSHGYIKPLGDHLIAYTPLVSLISEVALSLAFCSGTPCSVWYKPWYQTAQWLLLNPLNGQNDNYKLEDTRDANYRTDLSLTCTCGQLILFVSRGTTIFIQASFIFFNNSIEPQFIQNSSYFTDCCWLPTILSTSVNTPHYFPITKY